MCVGARTGIAIFGIPQSPVRGKFFESVEVALGGQEPDDVLGFEQED
jgi:hypothetical protein